MEAATSRFTFRHHYGSDVESIRDVLVSVYEEVYADRLREPFLSCHEFERRLDAHLSFPKWEAVVGYEGAEPVGYVYGGTRHRGSTFWQQVHPIPDDKYAQETGARTFALFELMVRVPWRKTGISRLLHDELLRHRSEERVCLFVEHDHSRVRALYESWGYLPAGTSLPARDAPLYDVMVLPLPLTPVPL
jgi:GNAT superfamily N-acetyltransferase